MIYLTDLDVVAHALRGAVDVSGAFLQSGRGHGVGQFHVPSGRVITLVEISLTELVHTTEALLRLRVENLVVSSSVAAASCAVDTRAVLDSALEHSLVGLHSTDETKTRLLSDATDR